MKARLDRAGFVLSGDSESRKPFVAVIDFLILPMIHMSQVLRVMVDGKPGRARQQANTPNYNGGREQRV